MRMFRSFVLRLSLILTMTAAICFVLMALTLLLKGDIEGMEFCFIISGLLLFWLVVNYIIRRKVDPELSVEVARILLPAGAVLSMALSAFLSLFLEGMIPGDEGKEHFILPMAGAVVAVFLFIRCFDVKWLRLEEEIVALEERGD